MERGGAQIRGSQREEELRSGEDERGGAQMGGGREELRSEGGGSELGGLIEGRSPDQRRNEWTQRGEELRLERISERAELKEECRGGGRAQGRRFRERGGEGGAQREGEEKTYLRQVVRVLPWLLWGLLYHDFL